MTILGNCRSAGSNFVILRLDVTIAVHFRSISETPKPTVTLICRFVEAAAPNRIVFPQCM